jgi:hypothetical protein
MIGDWIGTAPARPGSLRRAFVACALLASEAALAQDAAPPVPPVEGTATAGPEAGGPGSAAPTGVLDALGRWLGQSKATLDEGIKSTQDAIGGIGTAATGAAKDAANAAQQATGLVTGLPGTRIVGGRERCSVAVNGAPDCAGAANALCRVNGLEFGRALDINSRQKCPAWVWWSNRRPVERECKTENFVVRAICR